MPPPSYVPTLPPSKDIYLVTIEDFNPEEVARQISLEFFKLFEAIKPFEFLIMSMKYRITDPTKKPLNLDDIQKKVSFLIL
jgi:predicted component of type VI protein secretion system